MSEVELKAQSDEKFQELKFAKLFSEMVIQEKKLHYISMLLTLSSFLLGAGGAIFWYIYKSHLLVFALIPVFGMLVLLIRFWFYVRTIKEKEIMLRYTLERDAASVKYVFDALNNVKKETLSDNTNAELNVKAS